jgi:prepilin-type N-terminal cleavage/methylation domain-containing protein
MTMNINENRFETICSNRKLSSRQICKPLAANRSSNAFTLVELLTVMAIIGVLAALSFPILGTIKKHQYQAHAQGEMGLLTAAIDSYHDALGFYPPDNPGNPEVNQLYYELSGTTNTATAPLTFQTLDGASTIDSSQMSAAFGGGVSAFINCNKLGAGEDTKPAQKFLPEPKPGQTQTYNGATLLVTSVGGPDANYQVGGLPAGMNPWRYVSSNPTNNPGHYDLWMQLSIGNKKYLISNWSKRVESQ